MNRPQLYRLIPAYARWRMFSQRWSTWPYGIHNRCDRPPSAIALRSDEPVQLGMIALAERLSLVELLRFQDQLLRRDQAIVAGLCRTTIEGHLRQGRWQRIRPTVYLTEPAASHPNPSLGVRRWIRAVWMWAGDDAVITVSPRLCGRDTSRS